MLVQRPPTVQEQYWIDECCDDRKWNAQSDTQSFFRGAALIYLCIGLGHFGIAFYKQVRLKWKTRQYATLERKLKVYRAKHAASFKKRNGVDVDSFDPPIDHDLHVFDKLSIDAIASIDRRLREGKEALERLEKNLWPVRDSAGWIFPSLLMLLLSEF